MDIVHRLFFCLLKLFSRVRNDLSYIILESAFNCLIDLLINVRTLALFLVSIGNPPANTASGTADNGICRPSFSTTISLFQSTAKPVNIYNSSLLATTVKQGAGLVDIYHAITATTIISPSQLSLNDTIRKAPSYTVKVYNIGTKVASYKLSHVGAALATGKTSNDDQLLSEPLYSADYAVSVFLFYKFIAISKFN